ncbi:DUF559 domain-containing protein [Leucobacter chinensis]|uniref:DUF559 domain-containing protein n=1 Tax=Leucobacter chinensis TaxID=2851010 RepID=UPI001C210D3B|nr:DUF559 domain-containing protein [Leucobacter chinensis]
MPIDSPTPRTAFLASERSKYGLSRYAMYHGSIETPFHGLRAMPLERPRDHLHRDELLAEQATFFATKLKPFSAFSHMTALSLHGCPILHDDVLHVTVSAEASRPREQGVVGHRRQAKFSIHTAKGLPVVSPFTALLQSSPMLSELELIVAIDHLINRATRGTTVKLDHLTRLARATSARGVKTLRRALDQARFGAESRYETLLRLELVRRGFTDLQPQFVLHDAAGFVGRFDLVSRKHSSIFEYDGQQHRTNHRQYITDMQRLDRARLLGYRVLRFHFDDFAEGSLAIDAKLAQFGLR